MIKIKHDWLNLQFNHLCQVRIALLPRHIEVLGSQLAPLLAEFGHFCHITDPSLRALYAFLVQSCSTCLRFWPQSDSQDIHCFENRRKIFTIAGNGSRKGGHPEGWKTQTRREMADEMAWWADREIDLPPDPGARRLAEQRARGSWHLLGASALRPWLF